MKSFPRFGQIRREFIFCLLLLISSPSTFATSGDEVQARIDADLVNGKPIVVHLTVALCDNVNQGIVKVPKAIGNGQDPRNNLYWGALYGVKTHLPRKGGWKKIAVDKPVNPHILERIVFYRTIQRGAKTVPVYIVADAWDGAFMKESLKTYLQMTAGKDTQHVSIEQNDDALTLRAGGSAHIRPL